MFQLPAPLILGSQSPRRKQLLKEAGFDFEVIVRPVDETIPPKLSPSEVAIYIAKTKAEVFEDLCQENIIITSDTIVVDGKEILGKPANYEEAFEMIQKLAGHNHQVISGVCLYVKGKFHCFAESTEVFFRSLTAAEIHHYIIQDKPFDKAGSYGIQDWIGMIGIEKIDGDFYNVMGLPIGRLYQYLKQLSTQAV